MFLLTHRSSPPWKYGARKCINGGLAQLPAICSMTKSNSILPSKLFGLKCKIYRRLGWNRPVTAGKRARFWVFALAKYDDRGHCALTSPSKPLKWFKAIETASVLRFPRKIDFIWSKHSLFFNSKAFQLLFTYSTSTPSCRQSSTIRNCVEVLAANKLLYNSSSDGPKTAALTHSDNDAGFPKYQKPAPFGCILDRCRESRRFTYRPTRPFGEIYI